jgi:hypothetical protein
MVGIMQEKAKQEDYRGWQRCRKAEKDKIRNRKAKIKTET